MIVRMRKGNLANENITAKTWRGISKPEEQAIIDVYNRVTFFDTSNDSIACIIIDYYSAINISVYCYLIYIFAIENRSFFF